MNEEILFQEALSRSPEGRAAFLETACEGQPELRGAVERLLEAHEKSGKILDRLPTETVDSGPVKDRSDATVDNSGPHDPGSAASGTGEYRPLFEPGTVIAARYTLLAQIGKGGMGEVWIAKQTEPVKRKVALKLIKTGMDSKAVLARFEQERQALALMDHPNIAKVLDGGLTPLGQPFFVMELVDGLPLSQYCDEARLTPRERLQLFVPICQAVQHAHQKGIVHRDLKPANILVTIVDGKPTPKVIDFGVAKATAGRLTEESMSTQFGAVIGTFEYMSPEQAGFSGVDIDTRADIYSLGVILYELLTGLRPIDAKGLRQAALTEIIRIIREKEPSRPSIRLMTEASLPSMAALRQTKPHELMALLRGELDWVVMKCLEKRRERRYETANALARDIQRYLADETVEARPPSAGYRLGKFLRRNRGPVLAANLVLLAMAGGIVGTTFGMLRADQRRVEAEEARRRERERAEGERQARDQEAVQRAKAEQARDQTRQALDAMTSSVTGDSLSTQKQISAEQKKFLTEVLTYYQQFAGEKADDEPSRTRTAAAAGRVGSIEYSLGRTAEAAAAWRRAIDGYAKLAALFPSVPDYPRDLATNHVSLGLLLTSLGKWPEAEEQYQKAQALFGKLVTSFPTVSDYQKGLARSHINFGNLLLRQRQYSAAEEQYRKAQMIQEKLVSDFPGVSDALENLAACYNNRALVLVALTKRPAAEEQYRKALSIWEKLIAKHPTDPRLRNELAGCHSNLGSLLASVGKRREAEEHHRIAITIQEKLVAEFPNVPEFRVDLGGSYCNFGDLVKGAGQPGESLDWFDKAIRILTAVYEQDRQLALAGEFLGNSHEGRARAYDGLGKFSQAVKDWNKAIELSPIAEQSAFRAARATSRIQAGQVEEAVAEVAELAKKTSGDALQWYNFACIYAAASGKSADKKQEYAEQAMEYLQKAVKGGFKNAAHMAKDTDLDPIRGREDFKKLMEEIGAKQPG